MMQGLLKAIVIASLATLGSTACFEAAATGGSCSAAGSTGGVMEL